MLAIFDVDPLLFGLLIAINLQSSFLTPPMAMSAYYLKGVAPKEIELWDIFKGCFPFLGMILLTLVLVYVQPKIVSFLPDLIYNNQSQVDDGPLPEGVIDPAFFLQSK